MTFGRLIFVVLVFTVLMHPLAEAGECELSPTGHGAILVHPNTDVYRALYFQAFGEQIRPLPVPQ